MLTKKREVVNEHGVDKYDQMLEGLDDPDKITHTQNTMIPNFLDQAVLSLQEDINTFIFVILSVSEGSFTPR